MSGRGHQPKLIFALALLAGWACSAAAWISIGGSPAERELAAALIKEPVEQIFSPCQPNEKFCLQPRVRGYLPSQVIAAYARDPHGQAAMTALELRLAASFAGFANLAFIALWLSEKNRTRRFHIAGQQLVSAEEIANRTREK